MSDDLRLQPQMYTALEIAVLVKCLSHADGAELIERYAACAAAGASLDAATEAYNRSERVLNTIKDLANAQA